MKTKNPSFKPEIFKMEKAREITKKNRRFMENFFERLKMEIKGDYN